MLQNATDVFGEYDLPFETYFEKSIQQQNQVHDEIELIWVLRGEVTVTCEGVDYRLTTQNLFMINPFQVHSISSDDDARIIAYRFNKDHLEKNNLWFRGLRFRTRIYTMQELIGKYREVPLLITQLITLRISDENRQHTRYRIIGYYNLLIYELCTMLMKEKYLDVKKKNIQLCIQRMNTVINYISSHYRGRVSLEYLAKSIGISRYRLSHFVKENLGVSFRDYVTNMRLEHALRLLRGTVLPISEVSDRSGFSDVKYLNKLISERYRMTALKYRKKVTKLANRSRNEPVDAEEFISELKLALRLIKSGFRTRFS